MFKTNDVLYIPYLDKIGVLGAGYFTSYILNIDLSEFEETKPGIYSKTMIYLSEEKVVKIGEL